METAGALVRKVLAPGVPGLPGVMEPEKVDGEARRDGRLGYPFLTWMNLN